MNTQKNKEWNDKRSSYNVALIDGQQKVDGAYCHCDQLFSFSLRTQKKGEYKMRGRVGMRSPTDGHLVEIRGKKRRKKLKNMERHGKDSDGVKGVESLKVLRQIYLKDDTTQAIQKAVAHAAEALYAENIVSLEVELKSVPEGQLSPVQLVRLHGERYLATRSRVSAQTQRRNIKALESVASKLSSPRAGQITADDIRKVAKELGSDAAAKLRLTQQFWDYCITRGAVFGDNPFSFFFKQYNLRGGRNTPSLQRKAVTPASLPNKVEEYLNRKISSAGTEDIEMTGLLLLKEIGLTAADACRLSWSDVLFGEQDSLNVRIKLYQDDITGATHDYTRPCSLFGARELTRRYTDLVNPHGDTAPKKRYVLQDSTGQRIDKKTLTALCRTELLHAGMSYSDLQPDRSEPNGIGIRLLHKNYHNRLVSFCGLKNDPGAIKYLMGHSLAGYTTADHYRSFSDDDGQEFLRRALFRDGRFEDTPTGSAVCVTGASDGDSIVSVRPSDFDRLTVATVQYVLQPGEVLVVAADGGICGSYTASAIRRFKTAVADESTNCQLSFLH